jgi:hypothetical protein
VLKILAVLAVACAFAYAWHRNDLRRLTRDFKCNGPFDGVLEPCLVRFATGDAKTDCVLGSNSEGLFLTSTIEALQRNRWWIWHRRYYVIKTPLFIPWSSLQ